ncbi:MAG TPA: glycoside hydrolase family 3 N-terminal domain-containing protein [Baekduia sp.]|jgi:beta-N-acetylhexosaminidase
MSRSMTIGLTGPGAAAVAVLALALAGCGGGSGGAPGAASTGRLEARAPAPAGTVAAPAAAAPARPASARGTAAKLPTSIERSAARLVLIGFGGTEADAPLLARIAAHEWGGVMLEPGNGSSPQQVAGLVGQLRGAALAAHHEAPLIGAAQMGGENDAVPVGSRAQSAAADAAAAQRSALGSAKVLRTLGIRMVFAPVADTSTPGGPWEGLAFSDDAGTVTAMAGAAVAGWKQGHVAPVPGHFPGEGAASGDPVEGPATVGLSMAELTARDLRPFAALALHAPAIQLSSATYVAFDGVTPATLLPGVVALLRTTLKFQGVVVSGDLAAASLATGRPVADLAVDALKAGCDLLWIPGGADDQDAAQRAIAHALRTGALPKSRVADALARMDRLRGDYGVR